MSDVTRAVGVVGAGRVGQVIARRAQKVGWQVTIGARSQDSPSLASFSDQSEIRTGTFADAIRSAPLVVNATSGQHSIDALASGADDLAGRVVLDLANELQPTGSGFPTPLASPTNSLGQRIQQRFPDASVVKALNTMTNAVMVHPEVVPGDHVVFLSGDSDEAKEAVRELLRSFGWREAQFIDLGGIDTAASTEMMMSVWMRVMMSRGFDAPPFNWAVQASDR